jgi:hypothetical protein
MLEIAYGQHGMITRLKWRQDNSLQKRMPTTLWNPDRFHVLTMLHDGASFSAPWFINEDLIPLVETFFLIGGMSGKDN